MKETNPPCAYCGLPTEKGKRLTDAITGLTFHEACYFKALKTSQ